MVQVSAVLFFFAAAVTRYHLRLTETRWQILFWMLVAAGASLYFQPLRGGLRWAILASAAAVGAITVKLVIERYI